MASTYPDDSTTSFHLDYSQNTVPQPLQPEESLRSLLPEKLNVRQWQALTQSRQMVWVILGMG